MATAFEDVYDSFLSKIKDYFFVDLPTDEVESNMYKYMVSACAEFTICTNNLTDRDTINNQFNSTLTDLEIKIISTIMVTEWMNPFINNILLLETQLTDTDFKSSPQYLVLKQLQSLRSDNHEEVERLKGLYSYSGNLKSIFGC